MNLLAPISTIMTKKLITVRPDDHLKHVEGIFNEFRIHHIPVVDKGDLVGILGKTDFLLFKRGYDSKKSEDFATMEDVRLKTHFVSDIMVKGVARLDVTDKINVAIEVFKQNLLHALPIMDGDALVGMVTTHDLIKHLANNKRVISEYE